MNYVQVYAKHSLRKLTTGLSPTNGGEHNAHSTMNSTANFLREGLKFV